MNMKKKILVIGANGFTGRRILNDLSRNDEYIVTGCSLHDDIAPDSGNYRFISADVCRWENKVHYSGKYALM